MEVRDFLSPERREEHIRQLRIDQQYYRAQLVDIQAQIAMEKGEAEWPTLQPLGDFNPPEFPTRILPTPLRAWSEKAAVTLQSPPDLPALAAITVCAAALAKKITIRLKPGYHEPVNLWAFICQDSGERKSACLEKAISPLADWERQRAREMHDQIADSEAEHRKLLKQLERAEKAALSDPAKEDEARTLARSVRAFIQVRAPKMFCRDVTAEALVGLHARHDERMLLVADEGGPIENAGGRYNADGAANLDIFNVAYSGHPYRSTRVSRDEPDLERPALSILIAFQDFVLEAIQRKKAFKGSGFLARPLWALPRSDVGNQNPRSPGWDFGAGVEYHSVVHRLLNLPFGEGDRDRPAPHEIYLSAAAQEGYFEMCGEIQTMMRAGGQLEHLHDWGSKLAGNVMRVVAVLHAVEHAASGAPWSVPVPLSAVENGAMLARAYLVPHAIAAFSEMQMDPVEAIAVKVARWLERGKREHPEKFTLREAYRAVHRQREEVEPALARLQETGHIMPAPKDGALTGRPSSPYLVHPALLPKGAPDA